MSLSEPGTLTVRTDDLDLVARVRGTGRPVLLLHGFPDTHETWRGLEDVLLAAGHRTVALAMRGYAPSGLPRSGDYSLAALAGDVAAVLAHLGSGPGLVVGHDWGADAAYAAAALHPERIERMATLADPPLPVGPGGWRDRLARPHNVTLAHGRTSAWLLHRNGRALVDRLYRKWSPSWSAPEAHLAGVRDAFAEWDRARAAVAYYGATMDEAEREAVIRPIGVPTLAIFGHDEPRTRRDAFAAAGPALGSGSRVVGLEGVGHWPHLERPLEVGRLVRDWLTGV